MHHHDVEACRARGYASISKKKNMNFTRSVVTVTYRKLVYSMTFCGLLLDMLLQRRGTGRVDSYFIVTAWVTFIRVRNSSRMRLCGDFVNLQTLVESVF